MVRGQISAEYAEVCVKSYNKTDNELKECHAYVKLSPEGCIHGGYHVIRNTI